ncbi:S1/P1 nuclease [Syncephalis plumigaleata]|nr:S1/P1 nuclease [Syncephalis plumigaleata]
MLSNLVAVSTILFCISTASVTDAWGVNGHAAIGLLTEGMLTPNALNNIKTLSTKNSDAKVKFSELSTWADDIKKQDAYAWSSKLHFTDMMGEKPSDFKHYSAKDCNGGKCLITAIQNFTTQVTACDVNSPARYDALRFLIHFLGDLGQPLHASGKDRGGNDDKCTWGTETTNLHAVWDYQIINKSINDDFNGYVALLEKDIKGKYANQKESWLSCFQQSDLNSCAIKWIDEAQKFNCDYIFPQYAAAQKSGNLNLNQAYYQDNAERVNMFIARSAVRTAKYLNTVLVKCQ